MTLHIESAELRADLAHDGMLWATLYENEGRWYSGHVVARSETEAHDKLRPGETLDGQIISEHPDDGAALNVMRARTRLLIEVSTGGRCPHCGESLPDEGEE